MGFNRVLTITQRDLDEIENRLTETFRKVTSNGNEI